ncbi:hypothetical protein M3Y98_01121600 [Aphelenchoides besseyi]|nr:hypothetical protein M3Y98_01121600 [Aphelenchoides besseyi]KAI6210493.1 hypothetical protein M3Y96_00334300 [Aphelenchoides besseyi]
MVGLWWLLVLALVGAQPAEKTPRLDPQHYRAATSPCVDQNGVPQRCVPDFINAAFNLHVEVTNTCGTRGPTNFCVQTGHTGKRKDCDICDDRDPRHSHPAKYLTDFNDPRHETWWQSDTMRDGIQYPVSVNLTIRLGKSYDITYVRLKFVSPRPESFVIYKKTKPDSEWVPWQFYSGSCRTTFRMSDKAPILPGNEAVAQCTREYSDISPLTGSTIAFSTLEGRPSAENFEESETLQDWVTASEIKIVLTRQNTYGDEIFRDPRVLSSYYYAISDLAVGGRCKCNGHASQCVSSTGESVQQLVCKCEHNTAGVDCNECHSFYQDRPWKAATSTEANECLPCNCTGLSNRCFFDEKLYEETGHGGHCIDCAGNTQGPHCEECVANHWRRPREHYCTACQCNEVGSETQQCDATGQCKCKPGVTGQFCDRCENGFYDFGPNGCKDCYCDVAGSANNIPQCSSTDGACNCKVNVEGQRCDKCKPGYFNLDLQNPYGCSPCFCYGHSSICQPAEGFYAYNESSLFNEDVEQWTAGSDARPEDVQWAQLDKAVAISQLDHYPVYFFAPKKYLGDQRFAYNQELSFTFRLQQSEPAKPSIRDVILVGANGQELTLSITAQNNLPPSSTEQTYRFRVHANSQLQWNPRLREIDFIGILSNLTAIKIRGTYSNGDVGFLSNFRLGSAGLVVPEGAETQPAEWVESCQCGEEYVGQFCESCASGYKRVFPFGGPLAKCIKCDCHGHSDSCDAESGACICQHNTAGDTCEHCARGYYGDALDGTEDGCKKCDCPENGPCILMNDGDTICTECPEGYIGSRCEFCNDEYYGDPATYRGCQKCDCNGNIDPNSIGNCDSMTGECRRCIFHTTGFNCEKCEAGFWGDALIEPKGDCKPCNCYAPGTRRPTADYDKLECRQSDGQCDCQPNVVGQFCDRCEAGFFNLTSGSGCESCDCDPLGSLNTTCEVVTGQCTCKPGVTGRKCDQCALDHFGFSTEGCEPCNCNEDGSEPLPCDPKTGQCLCYEYVEGLQCDRCVENRYNLAEGCLECDKCYDVIAHRRNKVKERIEKLRVDLDDIQSNKVKVVNMEFDAQVQEVRQQVEDLHEKATSKLDKDEAKMSGQVNDVKQRVQGARASVKDVDGKLREIEEKAAYVELEIKRLQMDKDGILQELDNAISHVDREGQIQLQNAQNAANRFGDRSQQLSDLADEARRAVAGQEQQKKSIEEAADRTANLSKQALAEANEAIYGASTTSQQIETLNDQLKKTKSALNVTRSLAEQENADAQKTYDDAVDKLSRVESVKLTDVTPEDLSDDAQNQKEEASLSLTNAREKINENTQQLEDARTALAAAEHDLRAARAQQEQTIAALRDVEAARNRSKDAFDLATKTWNDAQGSLDSLTDFNDNIDASKEEAMRQLEKLEDVQRQIEEARSTTAIAEANIGSAKLDAQQAEKMAEKALEDANKIAEQAASLKEKTESMKTSAQSQKETLDMLIESIEQLDSTTRDFENQAQSDFEQSLEYLRKAILSDTNAKNLQSRLNESEAQLNRALTLLNSFEDVNDEQLSELELLLDEAEKRYDEAELNSLNKEEFTQAEQYRELLRQQLDELEEDEKRLRLIYDNLPTKCFNNVALESNEAIYSTDSSISY